MSIMNAATWKADDVSDSCWELHDDAPTLEPSAVERAEKAIAAYRAAPRPQHPAFAAKLAAADAMVAAVEHHLRGDVAADLLEWQAAYCAAPRPMAVTVRRTILVDTVVLVLDATDSADAYRAVELLRDNPDWAEDAGVTWEPATRLRSGREVEIGPEDCSISCETDPEEEEVADPPLVVEVLPAAE